MRKPKSQTAVLKFLANNPFSPAIVVQRGVNMRKGNIYSVLSRLVEKGNVVKQGKFYRLSESYDRATKIIKSIEDERMPLYTERKPAPLPPPNPLISVYSREIRFIEDGIDSLMITKNYLQRRIEQLELEDAKRATN